MGSTKTRGVVFDFGGVMTTCATPVRVKEIVDGLGLPWSAVTRGFERHRRDYDIGDITVAQFYARVWGEAGVAVSAADRAAIEEADTASFLYRDEAALEWMKSLPALGYRLGILTNMPHELAPRFKERFADVIAAAAATVISCEVRLVKPMRGIYDLTASRLGVPPGEILFFDDSAANCRGAEEAGWRAVRYEGLEGAKAAFAAAVSGVLV